MFDFQNVPEVITGRVVKVSVVTFIFLWHRETVLVTAAAGALGLAVIDVATNVLQAKVFTCRSLHFKKNPPPVFRRGIYSLLKITCSSLRR